MLSSQEYLRLISELFNAGNNEAELRNILRAAIQRGATKEECQSAIRNAFTGHVGYKAYTSAGQQAKEAEEAAQRILDSLK